MTTDLWETMLQLFENEYIKAIAILVITIVVLKIIEKVVFNYVKLKADTTDNNIDDLLADIFKKLNFPLYFFIGLRLATSILDLHDNVDLIVRGITLAVIYFYAVRVIIVIFDYSLNRIVTNKSQGDDGFDDSVFKFIGRLFRFSIWFIGGVILVSNLGYDVTALVAGLGVAGIAVAFAMQGILEDLFAYFSIFLDKPFRVGDFVKFGDEKGAVERIGIKSTRLRTPDGEELVAGNKHLTETELHNYGQMERRRKAFDIGVTYDTRPETLRRIPEIIEKVYSDLEGITLDRVHFKDFGDSSLNFEIVHFVESSDYAEYMDLGHKVNLKITERFNEEGIEFAFPTRTLHIEK